MAQAWKILFLNKRLVTCKATVPAAAVPHSNQAKLQQSPLAGNLQ